MIVARFVVVLWDTDRGKEFVEELGRELRVMVVKSYENKNNL